MYTTSYKRKWIRKLLIVLIFIIAATVTGPQVMMASYNNEYNENERMLDRLIVMFDPTPGVFPASEVLEGVRLVPRGDTLTDFPPNPTRNDGYVFDGWRLSGGDTLTAPYLVVNDYITLTAIWISAEDAPAATPTPTPGPSPEPGASPTPSPAPTTPSPAPTPDNKEHEAYRPNPGTNPIAISFMIFGAVLGLGIAAFGTVKLVTKHAMANEQYHTNTTRYKREARLTEFLEEDDTK